MGVKGGKAWSLECSLWVSIWMVLSPDLNSFDCRHNICVLSELLAGVLEICIHRRIGDSLLQAG